MNKEFKISGFKTPEKYFDTIEARLFSRMDEEKLPKENGFLVPKGYFENLENRLLNSEKPLEKPGKTIPLFSKKNYAYVAAIAASLILGILIFNPNQSNSTLDSIQLSMI